MKHPSHTPDAQWNSRYAKMITSAQEAVRRIKPGQRLFLATGAGVPRALVRALIQERSRLADIEVILVFVAGEFPLAVKELSDTFTVNTFFVADNTREMVRSGMADHTPILMSDIPRLFSSGQLPIDVAMIQVTPPDMEGEVNLGIAVDVVRCATENASLVLAQVNSAMPRTHGDSGISVWDLDLLIPAEDPLPEWHLPEPDEALERIGPQIAALVPDGATVQMGLGRAPQLVIRHLTEKRNLCIHTEMISDTVLELIAAGAILPPEHDDDHGQIVTSFAMGSRKLYDAVHDAPLFS
ncbi:MAG: 4-hydroxybutyrate CoA-transferase, partial [Magnetococcales bacterium]|nr:4-hydroxybutyrate CoA-transferase [Magnetococcales bacterium]